MKHSFYSNMKGTPSVNTSKMLHVFFFFYCEQIFKKGKSGKEGERLMTDVTFLPSGPMCSS